LLGARVIATGSSADKLAVAPSESADFGIDYLSRGGVFY
jgi:hypothetical protein